MEYPSAVSFLLAFSAGFLSFVSPCVLPLVPAYLSYITGMSLTEQATGIPYTRLRMITLTHSLMFISGFSTIFILFGISATAIGQWFLAYQSTLRNIGGLIVMGLGLYVMGIFKPAFLMQERRFYSPKKPAGLLGSFLVGIAFGAGWTPCVGPILGTILLYASSTGSVRVGIGLLAFYAMGLGLPFLLASFGMDRLLKRRLDAAWIPKLTGAFLIGIGFLLLTHSLTRLTSWLSQIGVGWVVGQ